MPWPRSAGRPRDSAPRRAFLQLSQASARTVEPGPRRFGNPYAESRAVFVAESNRRPRVVFELCPRRIFGEIGRGTAAHTRDSLYPPLRTEEERQNPNVRRTNRHTSPG